ncbi:MAG: ABC transporter ATP-binding protein [Desulfuromonadales bacterium]|nr:ABC transporter ATP-binding protein [Desulfuromonadales bacterium]
MIELSHISKSFNVGKGNQFTALDDVSLNIDRGKVTILKGPSGSGKTTLMTVLGCMSRPTTGRIKLHGINVSGVTGDAGLDTLEITSLPERFLTEIRRSTFGFIFQHFNLVKGLTVLENVLLPAYPLGENFTILRQRGMDLLGMFNITRHAAAPVDRLSGGEMQRVAIARALINNPAVIIADEPTAHLDSALSREFMTILADFKKDGRTILVASHDPIIYDSTLADTVIEMRDGRVTSIAERG